MGVVNQPGCCDRMVEELNAAVKGHDKLMIRLKLTAPHGLGAGEPIAANRPAGNIRRNSAENFGRPLPRPTGPAPKLRDTR